MQMSFATKTARQEEVEFSKGDQGDGEFPPVINKEREKGGAIQKLFFFSFGLVSSVYDDDVDESTASFADSSLSLLTTRLMMVVVAEQRVSQKPQTGHLSGRLTAINNNATSVTNNATTPTHNALGSAQRR